MSGQHPPPHEGIEEYQDDRASDEAMRAARAQGVERERVQEADRIALLAHEKSKAHRRIALAQLLAYVGIVCVFAFSMWHAEQTDTRICESAQENRDATRALVVAIGELGEDLVVGSDTETSPTPEQQATLDQFTRFQAQQLKALSGPVCHD
jgi:hypothetical protein